MAGWALKLGAALLTTITVLASSLYVFGNVKNPYAPLRPPVVRAPSPPPHAPPGRPVLSPSVRSADLPSLTFTYVS